MDYEIVIGLEVHVQLKTESKLFCGCSTRFGAPPNSQVCPVCLGFPGVLPVINERALTFAALAGLMLGSEISTASKFDRKNYFYPDLPKAYQISQYDMPLCRGGSLRIVTGNAVKTVRLHRIHLEEDAGKLVHFDRDSGVDYNRAGVPLIEIVSEPDLRAPQEAYEYLKALKRILEYLDISDCNMEEGSLRCDANISLRPAGEQELGTKTEIKNLNSFRNVEKALQYEAQRQKAVLDQAGRIVQETRLWDADEEVTRPMRSKEEAHDYRYFPEPDLVPVALSQDEIFRLQAGLPELPQVRSERFISAFGLSEYDADVLTAKRSTADFFEESARLCASPKAAANWIMGDLSRDLKLKNLDIRSSPVTPENLAGLIQLIEKGTISGKMAKEVFLEMFSTRSTAHQIVQSRALSQLSDPSQIQDVVRKVIERNSNTVKDYFSGKKNAIVFLVGQVMKETQGRANPKMVNEMLIEEIEKLR